MEITAEKLIELVEEKESWRCTAIDLENERDTLKEQIKVLKELILSECYKSYSSLGVYDEDKIKMLAAGITLSEIKEFIASKNPSEELEDE
jgi:hypothetical protein